MFAIILSNKTVCTSVFAVNIIYSHSTILFINCFSIVVIPI